MEPLHPEVTKLFEAKEKRRRELAALPYHEKVRIVVELQKMAAPILRARGINVRVWDIDNESRD
ncbi:MAG: hypothetical protein SGI88_10810 [Candidatus Hydrogenedentes bacterium]|nr:hypothetical protein [Candidatus Hydrogenedentota bacterium]